MTRPNHPQTTEKDSSDVQTRLKFWGVIVLAVLALLAYSYVLLNLSRLAPTPAGYIKMTVYALAIVLSVASLILAVRQQVDRALTIIFYYLLIALISGPVTTQGRTPYSTLSMLVIGYIVIQWLLPKSSRRRYMLHLAGAFVLAWVFEWINPPWRIATSEVVVGPIVAAILVGILAVLIAVQAWERSVRNKLLITFISMTIVATGILGTFAYITNNNALQKTLETGLTAEASRRANRIGDLLDKQVDLLTTLSLNKDLLNDVKGQNAYYTGDTATIQATLHQIDSQWRVADATNNNNDFVVQPHLTNATASELRRYRQIFPDNIEVFSTDIHGGLVGATNRTSDYYQADEEWWQSAYNNGQGAVYISSPEYDESAKAVAVVIALPMRDAETGTLIGILRTTYQATAFTTILQQNIGQTGEADMFIPGEVPFHFHHEGYSQVDPGIYKALQAIANRGLVQMNYEGSPSVILQVPVKSLENNQVIDNLGWMVVLHQDTNEAFAPVNNQSRGILIVIVIVLLFAAAIALGVSIFLVRPITQLTQTAEEVAGGNLNSRAKVTGSDEIGILASTFNSMSSQLQETLQGLEGRVAARTQDLATVAKISTQTSTIQDPEQMLATAVHLTQRDFGLYHAHVFTYRNENDDLQIVACGYKEGDEHEGTHGTTVIPLQQEQSLVARAGRTRKPVIVNDVRSDPGWLPNPMLPDTRAELAVPMLVGDELLGVLDVQSDHVDAFTEESANIQLTLAAQIATALKNATSLAEAQNARAEVEEQSRQTQAALAQTEKLFSASHRLTESQDLQGLVAAVVETLTISVVNRAVLGVFDYGEKGEFLSMTIMGNWWDGTGTQATPVGTNYPVDVFQTISLFASPTPLFFNDAFNDPRADPASLELYKRLNLRAVAVLPLFSGTRQIGVLMLEAESPYNFTQDEIRLFTSLAPQIATVLDNRLQFERTQQQAELTRQQAERTRQQAERESVLNLINQKIQGATTVEAVLQIAARELGHALGTQMTVAQLNMKDRK